MFLYQAGQNTHPTFTWLHPGQAAFTITLLSEVGSRLIFSLGGMGQRTVGLHSRILHTLPEVKQEYKEWIGKVDLPESYETKGCRIKDTAERGSRGELQRLSTSEQRTRQRFTKRLSGRQTAEGLGQRSKGPGSWAQNIISLCPPLQAKLHRSCHEPSFFGGASRQVKEQRKSTLLCKMPRCFKIHPSSREREREIHAQQHHTQSGVQNSNFEALGGGLHCMVENDCSDTEASEAHCSDTDVNSGR